MPFRLLRAPMVCVGVILLVSPALGAGKYGGGGGYSGGGSSGGGQVALPPPVDRSASTAARKDVNAAAAEVNKANAAVNAVVAKLRVAFDQTAEWKDAQAAVKGAQSELDAARAPVLAGLKSKSEYAAAKMAKDKAEAERDGQRDNLAVAPEDRARVAAAVFDATVAVSKLENDALAADPKVSAAQSGLAAANARASALLKTFAASLKGNPDWDAAEKVLDEKKQHLTDAQKTLAGALAQEAQAERDRQKQIAAARGG